MSAPRGTDSRRALVPALTAPLMPVLQTDPTAGATR
jgi:hypothetical protein